MLGTAAFGGLGLLLAGTLRAEVTLAAANLVWLVLLFAGGIAIPLTKYPHAVARGAAVPAVGGAVGRPAPRAAGRRRRPAARSAHPARLGRASRCPPPPGGSGGSEHARRVPSRRTTPPRALAAAAACRPTPWLRGLALASVVANVVIVVTGGAVRLTDSGLGCPTWPSCTDSLADADQAVRDPRHHRVHQPAADLRRSS